MNSSDKTGTEFQHKITQYATLGFGNEIAANWTLDNSTDKQVAGFR